MTSSLPEHIFASSRTNDGYTMSYVVSDMGETAECRFDLSMVGDYSSNSDDEVYVELVTV